MKIFANDQSYLNFAVVVFEDDKPIDRIVFHTGDKVKSNAGKTYGEYFSTTAEQLDYIYKGYKEFYLKHKPEAMVFEGLAFGAKGDRVFDLGGLYHHITATLYTEGLLSPENLHKVTPTEVKSRARLDLHPRDQVAREKDGSVIVLKSKKEKKNPMKEKKWIKLALEQTEDKWIIDGYSSSAKKTETGAHDLPDAYYIGKVWLEKQNVK